MKKQRKIRDYVSLEAKKALYLEYCKYFHDGKLVPMSPFFQEGEHAARQMAR